MKRSLGIAALVTLVLAGCAASPPAPASRAAPLPRKPVAVLVSVDHPRPSADRRSVFFDTVVFRLGLDGKVTTLPIQPAAESPIVPDTFGRRVLYSKETTDPLARQVRVYDANDGSDCVIDTGEAVAYGWDASETVILTGRVEAISVPPMFPAGANLDVADGLIHHGLPGSSLATVAVAARSGLSVSLWYLGADSASWYFATAGGDLLSTHKKNGKTSHVARWDVLRLGISMKSSAPETIGMPAVNAGLPFDTFAQTGMPIRFSVDTTTSPGEQWFEVRRVSDWKLLRRIVPPSDLAYPFVLSPDLTRLLSAKPDRSGPNPRMTSLQEVGARGKASVLVTVPAGFETLSPLAYVGDRYDFVFAAQRKTGDASYYLCDRRTGTSREIARLTKADLVGTQYQANDLTQPGRVVGIEYAR